MGTFVGFCYPFGFVDIDLGPFWDRNMCWIDDDAITVSSQTL